MMSGIVILTLMTGFISITWWAYSPYKRADFDEAAQLPLNDETAPEHQA